VFSLDSSIGQKVAFAAHYQNGRWIKSYLPGVPFEAAALSSNDIWVVGQTLNSKGSLIVMRWNGHRWQTSAFPKQRLAGDPVGLTATSPHDLWVTWAPSKSRTRGYLLHWSGKGWARVNFPSSGAGSLVATDGHGGLWVAGYGPAPRHSWLFLHWSAGRWTTWKVPLEAGEQPGNVSELALMPGTRSLWAIGHIFGPGGGTVLNRVAIWRYDP
jgi:hypothetical protein